MAVRSTALVFFSGVAPKGLWTSRYTVPAGRTAIVRTQALCSQVEATAHMYLGVRRSGLICFIAERAAAPSGSMLFGPQAGVILNAGDELLTFFNPTTGTATAMTYYAGGTLLLGDPS